MWKRCSNIFKGWLPKHVVLQNKTLKYYNLNDKQPGIHISKVMPERSLQTEDPIFGDQCNGFINFDSVSAGVTIDQKLITLNIKGG